MFRKSIAFTLAMLMLLTLVLSFNAIALAEGEKVTLRYANWNDGAALTDMQDAITQFNLEHPNTEVILESIPYPEYHSKLNTLIAAGECPDLFYITEMEAVDWGQKGISMDLKPLYAEKGIDMESYYIPSSLWGADGKIYGLSYGMVNIVTFFNKELFDEQGVPYPSQDGLNPIQWDDFVKLAKRMTIDGNGKHADEEGFDPNNIVTYGVRGLSADGIALMALAHSNGGSFFTEDGMDLALDTPESLEVLQAVADLSLVDHASPLAAMASALPGRIQMLKDKQVAMLIDGSYRFPSFAAEGMADVGVAPMPYFKTPTTSSWASCTEISATTKHPKEAFEFFEWFANPAKNPGNIKSNYPNVAAYYTDPTLREEWFKLAGFEGDLQTIIPSTMDPKVAITPEACYIKNASLMLNENIMPTLDKLWLGELDAKATVEEIRKVNAGQYQGRY